MANHLDDCDGNGTVQCVECQGEGGWHDCGEDCCCCSDPEEHTHQCPECRGAGIIACPGCIDDAPYVCPGCYAVGGEPCAPGCIDNEIEQERQDALNRGGCERFGSNDDDDESYNVETGRLS